MSLLFALFLVVHGGIHIGYICGPAWPFTDAAPWLVTGLGAGADTVRSAGIALSLVTFFGFLLAAVAAIGIIPRRVWAPIVVVASVSSAVVLVMFATPWTLPGLAIDGVLVWAALSPSRKVIPVFGR